MNGRGKAWILPATLAFGLALACGAGEPVGADTWAIDAHVHAVHDATQELTPLGSAVADALFDVVEGKGDAEAVHAAHRRAVASIASQRQTLEAYDGPTPAELVTFHDALAAYLDQQEAFLDGLVEEGLPVAVDGSRDAASRGRALAELAQAAGPDEAEGAERVQVAMEALYASF